MRVPICYEGKGKDTVNGQFLEHDSIKWEEDKSYPITWEANWSDVNALQGTATDIRREDDGTITAEIDTDQLSDQMRAVWADVGTTIYVNQMVSKKVEGVTHIVSGQLKALFFTMGVPWRNPPLSKED